MNVSRPAYKLMLPIIDLMNGNIQIESVTTNTDGTFTITTCNTIWASKGFDITINDIVYKIVSVVTNDSITLKGDVVPPVTIFSLYRPKFMHGTIQSAETELNAKVDKMLLAKDKFPLIWLHEYVHSINYTDESEPVERITEFDLYLLMDADFASWTTDDHYEIAIVAMRQMYGVLIDAMKESGLIEFESLKIIEDWDMPRFGRWTGMSGYSSTPKEQTVIFAQHTMSGTKVRVKVPWSRGASGSCCAKIVLPPVVGGLETFNVFFNGALVESFTHPSDEDLTLNILPEP